MMLQGYSLVSRDILKVYPRGDRSKGLWGVFAARSPVRPNPIGISELKVLAIHGNQLEVSGLDILDGTPKIDIKKKISRPETWYGNKFIIRNPFNAPPSYLSNFPMFRRQRDVISKIRTTLGDKAR